MHSRRHFALVFPSTLCFCPATAAGMRGRSGASSSSTTPPPPPLHPPCVFLTQISFVTLFLRPSLILPLLFFYHFLATSLFLFIVHEGDLFFPCTGGWLLFGVFMAVCVVVVVVVRNQPMTSPLHRECVFAVFLECRPVKVSE